MQSIDAPGQESNVGLWAELSQKVRVSDIMLILTIPVVLTVVHLLPVSIQQSLILDYGNPSMFNLWSAAYVHRGFSHFSNNLVVYCITIVPAYLLFVLADKHQLFRYTLISFLIVLPPAIALLNTAVFSQGTGAGFSGIGSAIVGLLPVALVLFIHSRVSNIVDLSYGVELFLVVAGIITMIYQGVTEGTVIILISGFLAIVNIRRVGVDEVKQELSVLISMGGYFELVLFTILLFLLSPLLLFPEELIQDGQKVNILSHYVGLVIGFFGTTIFAMYRE